jgi:hypothetical protein
MVNRECVARALRLTAAMCCFSAIILLIGCNSYNPNLGSTPTQTSALSVVTPSAVAAGSSGFTLTVNGAGFVSGSTVLWNGSARPTAFISATQLVADISAADVKSAGTVNITVQSPGPNTGTSAGNNLSNVLPFTITAANNPVPVITQLGSSVAKVGGPGFPLRVTGTGFISGSQVQWEASSRPTSFDSATQLTAQIPASDIAALGTARITVFNPAPGGGSSNTLTFTINATGSAVSGAQPQATSANDEQQRSAAISAGRRYIAFVATTPDAAPGSGAGLPEGSAFEQVFVRDTCEGAPAGCTPQTTLVSAALIGPEADGSSHSPVISADGRFVVFASDATNLVAGDNNGATDVFLRDTCIGAPAGCTPQTTRISVAPDGGDSNGASASPSLSADGRFVAFDSVATNLVLNDAPASGRTFLRDTCFGSASDCTPGTSHLLIPPGNSSR